MKRGEAECQNFSKPWSNSCDTIPKIYYVGYVQHTLRRRLIRYILKGKMT